MPKVIEDLRDQWEVATSKVPTDIGVMIEVQVVAMGQLGFHKAVTNDQARKNLWTVTHLPSGLSIVLVKTEEDAVRVIEDLWHGASYAFRHLDRASVVDALPTWVRPWIEECRRVQAHVDPQPYINTSIRSGA